jgi:hypothetical protein
MIRQRNRSRAHRTTNGPVTTMAALFAALAALLAVAGCGSGMSYKEQGEIGQAVVTDMVSKIEGAQAERADFSIEGTTATARLTFTVPGTDEAEVHRIMLDGARVIVAVSDRLGKRCVGIIYVNDGNGRRYDASDLDLVGTSIDSDQARELLR